MTVFFNFHADVLRGLEVSVYDFVKVKVVHASCNAHGPVHQEGGSDFPARPQHLVQLALGAVFHQDTVTRSLGTHTPREQEMWHEEEKETHHERSGC